jgi:hypothetical protein
MNSNQQADPVQTPKSGTSNLCITRFIPEAKWARAEIAFYSKIEVTRVGTIHGLRDGILVAFKELIK